MTDKISNTLASIHSELVASSSVKMREGQQHYFKESVNFLGCSLPQCNKIAGEWSKKLESEGWSYDERLLLAEELLKAGSWEEGSVGLDLVQRNKRNFREGDFETFERWLRDYVSNWAHTDSIAPHIFGELVEMYPALSIKVFDWTKSSNRWMRRASAVTYILHAKRGNFHN